MATYSRAATVNGYAALASYIQRQSTFVAGLAAAGTEPTAPQLARFQSRTTGVLRRLTDGAPPPVAALAEQLCDAVDAAEDGAGLGAAFAAALDEARVLSAAAGVATASSLSCGGSTIPTRQFYPNRCPQQPSPPAVFSSLLLSMPLPRRLVLLPVRPGCVVHSHAADDGRDQRGLSPAATIGHPDHAARCAFPHRPAGRGGRCQGTCLL